MSFSSLRFVSAALLLLAACDAGLAGQGPPQVESGSVYLAYAGPHAASPPSAFGHLFLALPADPGDPVPLWDVVSFAAEADEVGPLRFAVMGILGGFEGRFERRQFHELSRDYQVLEDRDLWLFEVRLNKDERRALETELERVAQQSYSYTFFGKNCAYYLHVLLAAASSDIPPPQGISSPTGVVRIVTESGSVGDAYVRPAISSRVERLAEQLPRATAARLRGEQWPALAADTSWIAVRSPTERQFLQEYISWKALVGGEMLSDSVRAGLDLIRHLNAQHASVARSARGASPGRSISTPQFHKYTRISGGYLHRNKLTLRLRPGSHDAVDSWVGHRPVNTLELLAIELSTDIDGGTGQTRLEEFVLFSQRSLNPSTRLIPQASWMLEAVARRGGVFGPSALNSAMRIGMGHTKSVGDRVFVSGLLTTGTVTDWNEAVLAVGLEGGVHVLVAPRMRLGASWRGEQSILGSRKHYWMALGFARIDITPWTGVRLIFEQDRYQRPSIGLALDWYP